MTLTDTGPLVALLSKKDPGHAICVTAAKILPPGPFISTWPCFAEAMHLVCRAGGYPGQERLWRLLQSQKLVLHHPDADQVRRMAELMKKYRDTPMDLADASLVATAESLGLKKIFTLDSDFRVYRLADGTALEIVP